MPVMSDEPSVIGVVSADLPAEGGGTPTELRAKALELLRRVQTEPHHARELFDEAANFAERAARIQAQRDARNPTRQASGRPKAAKDAEYFLERAVYCLRLARRCKGDPLAETFRDLGHEFADLAVTAGADPAPGGSAKED
jgi:hypothetical protein